MCIELRGQMSFYDCPAIAFGKTSQERSAATEERISDACWRSLQGSQSRPLLFLSLHGASGAKPESSRETDGRSPGGSTTRSIGVFRRGEEESPLFATSTGITRLQSFLAEVETDEAPAIPIPTYLAYVLDPNAEEKYDLSAVAAQGIIRRSSERGKVLPEILQTALEQTIARA